MGLVLAIFGIICINLLINGTTLGIALRNRRRVVPT